MKLTKKELQNKRKEDCPDYLPEKKYIIGSSSAREYKAQKLALEMLKELICFKVWLQSDSWRRGTKQEKKAWEDKYNKVCELINKIEG